MISSPAPAGISLAPLRLVGYGLARMTDTPHIAPNLPRRVEILAFETVQLLDVAGPLQVFATANDLATHRRLPAPYALEVVAPTAPSVRTSAGLGLVAAPLPAA